ncbi:helix-turn-helix transcriptional regulator [Deminuibacter soli]|uniref:AraC family transcriptional regulator n=1 Tax=Deminuibacter soli TaxID=2291815 RepID=A0A3E1NIM7_9BACT|nr:helix-turn-helix transcriptional regulator [Deminuibacter soli]RFM27806.1 AraC family transcriptional regulator [Deminuibacter soli]
MLFRFPPIPPDKTDATFLCGKEGAFAKLKIESKAGKRTVFLTEHTLLFVRKGAKLLHFSTGTVTVTPDNAVLLKKGIYVMAEYIEEGLSFEALLLFLPVKLLKALALQQQFGRKTEHQGEPFMLLPCNDLMQGFKEQLRQYFDTPVANIDQLLPLKQKEILLLLISSGQRNRVAHFILDAISTEPEDLEYTVRTYLLQPVTLEDLANLSNRSLASFKRDFQRLFNAPPKQWINRQRLEYARLLLQNSNQRVAEITTECGFESPSHFIRLFKKTYGHTPQSLRADITID